MSCLAIPIAVVLIVGLVAADRLPATAAQDGAATPVPNVIGFVGAWLVTPAIDGQATSALTTFTSDGTLFTSNRPVQPAPAALAPGLLVQSLGHGAWVATGDRTADVTFVFLQVAGDGSDLGTRTTRGSLELDATGNAWTGSFTATIAAPSGEDLETIRGSVQATRILADHDAVTPAATPVTGYPGPRGFVDVTGLVDHPLRLTTADLRSPPTRTVEVRWHTPAGGVERHTSIGAPLQAILKRAVPRLGAERDAQTEAYVAVNGWDGYRSVVALGELLPRLGGDRVILAWEQDGRPLPPEHRPARLIVPGD